MTIENQNLIAMIELPHDNIMDDNNRSSRNNETDEMRRYIEESREINPRFLSQTIVNDSSNNLNSIIDYVNEPLLSLIDACQPLFIFIPNLSDYIEIALEKSKIIKDNLTQDESASIYLYTMKLLEESNSFYILLNNKLKNTFNSNELRPWYKYLKLFLTALSKLPFTSSQVVWRGIKRNISDEFREGSHILWWSFSSCTSSLQLLQSDIYLGNVDQRTLISIETINGKFIQQHSQFNKEEEILLLPGTYMKVQSKLNPSPNLYIIHLKQIIPQQNILLPPFQGAVIYPRIQTRKWYQRKTFLISLTVLIIICIIAIILGIVFRTRKHSSTKK
ncbi:unnamed protein product [Adineta steineri]|uniref:NAD(P)(+)--arginine ADP-ribosyltransferase n=1 Tax=Adineta steineri TaxID=433720 RepID=A0A814HT47_9BILA|nr:unnamed protein product [Adineta steineri]CAF1013804.1 unnamed protein product [Adineta steineri]CAF1133725.1 unnamed protein product [Adineta steineri]